MFQWISKRLIPCSDVIVKEEETVPKFLFPETLVYYKNRLAELRILQQEKEDVIHNKACALEAQARDITDNLPDNPAMRELAKRNAQDLKTRAYHLRLTHKPGSELPFLAQKEARKTEIARLLSEGTIASRTTENFSDTGGDERCGGGQSGIKERLVVLFQGKIFLISLKHFQEMFSWSHMKSTSRSPMSEIELDFATDSVSQLTNEELKLAAQTMTAMKHS